MLKWIVRLIGGPKRPSAAKVGSPAKPGTEHFPKDAPRPDFAGLQAKYSKEPKRKRHKKSKGVRPVPNGHHHGGRRP